MDVAVQKPLTRIFELGRDKRLSFLTLLLPSILSRNEEERRNTPFCEARTSGPSGRMQFLTRPTF